MISRRLPGAILLRLTLLAGSAFTGFTEAGEAQAVRRPGAEAEEVVDSTDVLGRARRAQSRFEQRRVRFLPLGYSSSGGTCDEYVGRFCVWYDEGEWVPEPDAPEVVELRDELLAYLDSVQGLLPGDEWILGQRAWYRIEAGRWRDALQVARDCGGGGATWWCAALEGLALHGMGRFGSAAYAFDRALDGMDPERARRWRMPRRAVDGDARDFLDGGSGGGGDERLARMWAMADPLYLVPGNDRLTAHYARWTVSTLRERARNPFHIPWGRDLEELTVRHGWEVGWERARPSVSLADRPNTIGHKHPEGRDYLPPGRALADPGVARPVDLVAGARRPRSLYAPRYAPVLLPLDGQVAVFPRGDRLTVVATHFLPDDTTWHARHDHERPWMDPVEDGDAADVAGLFLVPVTGAGRLEATQRGRLESTLVLGAPAGEYLLSVEAWSPSSRRAGRHRQGVRTDTLPPDVATLSDLLLVRGGGPEPANLRAAAERAVVRPVVSAEEGVGIVWEVGGLGWQPELVSYRVWVERVGGGLLRRLGQALRVVGPDRPLSLEWEEPAPDRPQRLLRWLDLDLPRLTAGDYRVHLEADLPGRPTLMADARFAVR